MPSSSSRRKLKRFSEREKEGLRHAHRKLGIRGRERNKGRLGHHKQKWTSEEEAALVAGVAKQGAGKWKNILKDPEFAQPLSLRSNIDLKDKWRNMSPSLEQVTKKKRKNLKSSFRFTVPSLSRPSGTSRNVVIDSKTEERYSALIFEALLTMTDPDGSDVGAIRDFIQQRDEVPTPQNFKRVVGARLRSLVSLGKLEKTSNGFKIKEHSIVGTKAPSELATSTETEDDAVHITAYIIADAENKSFLAAEAMKEAERVSEIAEETESMLLLVKEINEQCNVHMVRFSTWLRSALVNMAGLAPEGAQFDAKQYDSKMNEILSSEGQEFFTSYDEVHDSFDAMGLQENLLRGIYAYGFEKPSAIQQRGIVPFCRGLDVIQQAQSGTGKTATFCSGILQQLDYGLVQCQALVLAPTRELAQQIEKVMRALGDYLGVKVHACVGGTSIREDQRILQAGVHVVVGTPGRVFDMLRRQSLRADYIKMFVLDEADEMLSRGFKDQIYDIFQLLPSKVQVGVFSATMPPEALEITRKFMNKPVRILVKRDELTLEGIKQFYVNVDKEEWKLETLCDLYETLAITQSVIFVNTRRKVDWLTDKMRSRDHTVSATHGDMDQNQRDIIMREFRSGSSRVLITTDLLARGIDVQQVSLVINYDLPTQPENYLHRIGRSGRFGRKGVAINFVTKDDDRMLFDIQRFYNVVIEELPSNFFRKEGCIRLSIR
ncbi:hypothetical protein ACLB2K_066897 [Fragaria x ananassa]